MTYIDEMIKELCPEGVEWKTLGEVFDIVAGGDVPKDNFSERQTDRYLIPILSNGIEEKSLYGWTDIPKVDKPSLTVSARGTIGWTSYREKPFYPIVRLLVLTPKIELNLRYAYHFMKSIEDKYDVPQSGIPQLTKPIIKDKSIPLPPLEIQQEIVKILDKFTEYVTELTAELTAELTFRQKQYSYFRDKLLSFDDESIGGANNKVYTVQWKTLGEVCRKVSSGGTPKSDNEGYYGGDIPWLRTQDIDFKDIVSTSATITQAGLENSSAKWVPINSVVIAMYGATAGKSAVTKIPLTTNQACCNLEVDEELANYRYVYHWVYKNYELLKAKGQGSQSNISGKIIKDFPIPLPSLDIQSRIVEILDNFDTVCNDLNIGLPKEIELRQKQYEFFRDKLLTFAAAGVYTDSTVQTRPD